MSDPLRIPLSVTEQDGHLVVTGEVPKIESWPSTAKAQIASLPRGPGVYALFQQDLLVYVGESDNIQESIK